MSSFLENEAPTARHRFNEALSRISRWYNRQPPQVAPHGFTSDSYVAPGVASPIPVNYIWTPFASWRLVAILISLLSLYSWGMLIFFFWFLFWLLLYAFLILNLVLRTGSTVTRILGFGRGRRSISLTQFLTDLFRRLNTLMLRLVSKLANLTSTEGIWTAYWSINFMTALRRSRFMQNYMEAWKLKYPERIIAIFFDGAHGIDLPYANQGDTIDDGWLWNHVSSFYRMSRIQAGPLGWLLPTSLVRVEIVKC